MSYTHFEVKDALESLTVLIDTREQDVLEALDKNGFTVIERRSSGG